ncbi:MAG: M48 family metalloprotease [Endomicrobiales bacterium]|nr:M48 family metalloprotease [Endomicrobiales bacterium]
MFYSLPAETYIEIQEASKKKTTLLLVFLFLLYFLTFYLITEFTLFFLPYLLKISINPSLLGKISFILIVSFFMTYFHYQHTINTVIPQLLQLFNIEAANPNDEYHKRFSNIVTELSQATGIYNVRPGIISTTSTNAFSMSNGKNFNFVVITEGLLARLNRSQLESVVAHEFSHILHGDSLLATLICSLFGIFEQISETLKSNRVGAVFTKIRFKRSSSFYLYFLIIRIICSVSVAISRVASIFISRQREILADATSVKLTRNPLGLAEALYKISKKWRGEDFVAKGFAALFIMNPHVIALDDEENWFADMFSTHPPIRERLRTLLSLAKEDIYLLQQELHKPEYKVVESRQLWWTVNDGKWLGPFTCQQLSAVSGIMPLSWICKDGTRDLKRLKDEPELESIIAKPKQEQYNEMLSCPRCNQMLIKRTFEGTSVYFCMHCKGHLVKEKNFIKILARHYEPLYKEIINEVEALKKKALTYKKQAKTVYELDSFPSSKCPKCGKLMSKYFHSYITFIVLDKCHNCKLIWFDEKELEYINSLVAAK